MGPSPVRVCLDVVEQEERKALGLVVAVPLVPAPLLLQGIVEAHLFGAAHAGIPFKPGRGVFVTRGQQRSAGRHMG